MCQTELLFVIVTVCWAALNLAHNVGGMKSCRLRAISYQVTQKLKRATTIE